MATANKLFRYFDVVGQSSESSDDALKQALARVRALVPEGQPYRVKSGSLGKSGPDFNVWNAHVGVCLVTEA